MKTRFHSLEKCFLAFCLALSLSLPVLAEPTATATLVPDTIRVGDPALLTLTIAHPDSVLPVLPALDRGDAIRLLAPPTLTNSPAPDAPGQTLTRASYRLTSLVVTNDNPVAPTNALITFALAPGAALPDASAALPAPIPFPFANLAVETTLSPAGDTPLQPPILAPLAWPAPSWHRSVLIALAILLGLLLLAALVLLVHYLLRRRRAAAALPPPVPPPHEVALAALAALEARHAASPIPPEPFIVELTFILRRYLEARVALRAPTSTTDEFIRAAATAHLLATPHQTLVSAFLRQADLVKFACADLLPADQSALLQTARRLVLETVPPPPDNLDT